MIAGVDGIRGGWIAALETSASIELVRFASVEEIAALTDLTLVVIDAPIGLLERGTRRADQEARHFLRTRSCCVFTAPIRPMLRARTLYEASAIRRALEGKGCTAQLWGIMPKIREVDEFLQCNPTTRDDFFEGHPEVSFAVMNGGSPVPNGKNSQIGREQRTQLLRQAFPDLDRQVTSTPKAVRSDALDALVMLWTARRIQNGTAKNFPGVPEIDACGLKAQIKA